MHTFMLQEATAMFAIVKLHVKMRCVNWKNHMRRVRMHALNDDFAIVFAPAALLTSAPAGLLTQGRVINFRPGRLINSRWIINFFRINFNLAAALSSTCPQILMAVR